MAATRRRKPAPTSDGPVCCDRACKGDCDPEGYCPCCLGDCTAGLPGSAPLSPTRHLPGTPQKVAVMTERAKLGQSLHHPRDSHINIAGAVALLGKLPPMGKEDS